MTDTHDLTTADLAISSLKLYKDNPRKGDVAAIKESLNKLGQYRPVVVNKGSLTGRENEVLAGNHTVLGAKGLGWKSVKAVVVDVDEETAARIVLADNKTADLGCYDEGVLASLLVDLPDLEGTGYTAAELDDLLAGVEDAADDVDDTDSKQPEPIISYNLIFDDQHQQDVWFEFTKWLKRTYSDKDTVAERLTEYLKATAGDRAA